MSLHLLEKTLTENQLPFQRKPDGTLLWPQQGRYVLQPIIVAEEAAGCLRAHIAFPLPVIEDPDGFCDALAESFVDMETEVCLERCSATRMLELCVYATADALPERVEELRILGDDVHALLEHLREHAYLTGYWDGNLLMLAFMNPELCASRA